MWGTDESHPQSRQKLGFCTASVPNLKLLHDHLVFKNMLDQAGLSLELVKPQTL